MAKKKSSQEFIDLMEQIEQQRKRPDWLDSLTESQRDMVLTWARRKAAGEISYSTDTAREALKKLGLKTTSWQLRKVLSQVRQGEF